MIHNEPTSIREKTIQMPFGVAKIIYLPGVKPKTGYTSKGKAEGYVLTQDCIVDKSVFYDQIIKAILNKTKTSDTLKIFEPGVGPAVLLHSIINSEIPKEYNKIEVILTDISEHMVNKAISLLESLDNVEAKNINLVFYCGGGTDISNSQSLIYKDLHEHFPFDVIITSQFEHYLPNSNNSELANILIEEGKFIVTKSNFRMLCKKALSQDGMYFAIDDFIDDSRGVHTNNLLNWDMSFISEISSEKNIEAIRAKNPRLANKIESIYGSNIDLETRLATAKAKRESRRIQDKEEIQKLSSCQNELKGLFSDVSIMEHPRLKNFSLFECQK